MSTPTFLAWSLIAAGAFALLYFVLERYVHKPEARVTGPLKRTTTALALIFYGGIIARSVTRLFFSVQVPAWTQLLSSAVPLALGLFFLITAQDDDAKASLRVFGGILIVIGILELAHDGYRYAISPGTAASLGVR
jgi:hypothetical protein